MTFTKLEKFELEGSKGEAHFVIRWPISKSTGYIKILDMKAGDNVYTEQDSSQWKIVQKFECRGLEMVNYMAGEDFCAESIGGASFSTVDLTDCDWGDYDEENSMPVSISNMEFQIVKSKD